MYVHKNKAEGGRSCAIIDEWEPFKGRYPDPTPEEYFLVRPYLRRFVWEANDFDESQSWWISLKDRLQLPHLRQLLIKFLRQVRETKGYDVDMSFDFIKDPYTVFVPRSLDDKKFYDEAMDAAKFAIGEISASMISAGKSYELVRVEKSVSSTIVKAVRLPVVINNILLLTFTAKEIIVDVDADANAITFQAMVVVVCDRPSSFQLTEWKFKPTPMV